MNAVGEGEAAELVTNPCDLAPLAALEKFFGFQSFRPLQEAIVGDVLAGRDVFALLPTGGGKSLCYQLPAVMRAGLTVVVSPLIALMKDQVDGLLAAGIPATFLNSSLELEEVRRRQRGLERGEFHLLYLAPERLALPHVRDELAGWNVARVAIDEAHCISEWGHDFRPEYRRLAELRAAFPRVPLLALTATATDRVRQDILELLGLRDPRCYEASFNRPNLTYRVAPKRDTYRTLLGFVRARAPESGIVYTSSRRGAEELAGKLTADGVPALPYHAGLGPAERARNQERFVRDDVRVICATVAFGMGIDKPNVRFVVHYDLPKNLEGYYQETGRAGRDGLPADCLLFFSAGDVAKQRGFIEEKSAEAERALALRQLRQMVDYAERSDCRRRALLAYFGETFGGACDACDNCLEPRRLVDETLPAQKFLSCVVRIRQRGFGVGLHHVVDVLLGRETDNVRRWEHDYLSTFGIGKELTRERWLGIGRELVRAGFLRQTPGSISVLELTQSGRSVLAERAPVMLPAPAAAPPRAAAGRRRGTAPERATVRRDAASPDENGAFELLRALRKRIADERDVPAYVIFPDTTLRAMARELPRNATQLRGISGVGDKKLVAFGDAFLAEINRILDT
ncbi:MAG: DNA helicase RecQ [Vulcanimicrobiaceae bacterium]